MPNANPSSEAGAPVDAVAFDRMQAKFEEMFRSMQSEQSRRAYDALEAITAEQLPAVMAKAHKQMLRYLPSGRRT
jgi:hypothetical protein